MNRVRNLLVILAALLAVPVFAGTATAHVEMTPSKAPAGKPVDLQFQIGHGCEGKPTIALVVELPKEASEVKPATIDGWKSTVNAKTITWSGGSLPDHHEQAFPFRATLSGKKGDRVMFKAVQDCGSVSTAWIQPASGGTEPEHPAPAVTLSSSAAAPVAESEAGKDQVAEEDAAITGDPTATAADSGDDSAGDDGGSGKSLLLIIVAGLAIGTIAGLVVRARRERR